MADTKEISVFVDESGSFAPVGVDVCSPYYLLCMVFHDQSVAIDSELSQLSDTLARMGLSSDHAIHAGLLIRREECYAQMPRQERIGIFRRMMIFIQKANFKYRCFKVFKPYSSGVEAIHDALLQSILAFLVSHRDEFNAYRKIKVYYDDGQSRVTSLLKEAFSFSRPRQPLSRRLCRPGIVCFRWRIRSVRLNSSRRNLRNSAR